MPEPTRRHFVAGGATLLAMPSKLTAARRVPIVNPLVCQRADAQIFRHSDGQYYFTGSVPEYDRVALRRASSIGGLSDAAEVTIWRREATGRLGGFVWAPELHMIDGHWYVYVAVGDAAENFRIRTYALRCDGPDPLTGRWSPLGQVETPWDTFTLDSTIFVHRGTRYLCWAQHEPGIDTNSNLYLAPLATPTTLAARPTRLTVPELPWEVRGYKVAEAPALLARNGRLFLTYSASATDARYCMGMLTACNDADIMDPSAWSKSQVPVMYSDSARHIYGPGHNSFTVDECERDILVFHARDYEKIEGNPLFDPNRHTRVQPVRYGRGGIPILQPPAASGPLR